MLWKKKSQRSLPTQPTEYPSGTCVQTEKGYYYIRSGKKFRIKNLRILDSWGFERIVQSTEAAISNLKNGGTLGFRDGSLINSWADGALYVISESKKRRIVNPDYLDVLGVMREDFVDVSLEEAKMHMDGLEIG